jgi:hypothetical protein
MTIKWLPLCSLLVRADFLLNKKLAYQTKNQSMQKRVYSKLVFLGKDWFDKSISEMQSGF